MVVSAGAIVFLLLSAVSVRDLHGLRTPGQLAGAAPAPVASASLAPVPGALLEPLAGGLIPAVHAGPDSELLAPAPRQSIGVAAFTPQPTAAGRTLSDSTPPPAP